MNKYGFIFGRYLICCVLVTLITGCGITRDYKPPAVDLQEGWRVDYETADGLANTKWWENFQDPILDRLIKTALNENKDLRMAAARVEESAARLGVAYSDYYPQLNYRASASTRRDSLERTYPFGRVIDRDQEIFQTNLAASWEFDLWGRLGRASEAARADLLSTEEARRTVIMTLVSAVAINYFELLKLDRHLRIAENTLVFRQRSLQLYENKRRGGQISELDLAQVRSSYEQIMTRIPVIEMQIARQENALSVLLGRNPGSIERAHSLAAIALPDIPQGIPSDVLVRRPDIRKAEQDLIAANAKIGVARTLYFPSISLTGLFGYASNDISTLLQSSANIWEAGGGIIGPIFSGGRIKGEIRKAEANYEFLLNEYLKTVQTAFREVNDALISIKKIKELNAAHERLISALKDYLHYSRESYESGYTNYLTVLDAESKLFDAEMKHSQSSSELYISIISVYKAMGGGWVEEAEIQIESLDRE